MAKKQLTIEEKLQAALVPAEGQPYKVPENWCWTYLVAICEYMRAGGDKPKSMSAEKTIENYIPVVANGLQDDGIIGYTNVEKEKVGTLTVSGRGTIGHAVVRIYPYVPVVRLIVLSPNGAVSVSYLKYIFDCFEEEGTGSSIPQLTVPALKNKKIPLPPLAEQSRIVARIESLFAKLDEVKEKIQEVLDGADLRRAAILHQAFTGKLTEKWRRENSVSDDWDYKLLYQTDIQIIDGDRGKNYPKKDEFTSSGYCVFLNAKNVTKNGFLFDEIQYISKEKDESLRKGKLERGDIVLTTRGTVGNIAYYDEKIPFDNMRINSGMVIYRGGMDFYKPFLIWLYKSSYIINQIKKLKTGSAQPQLPIKVMNNLNICIPSIPEQQEIVRLLDDLLSREQATVKACEKALNTIDTLKKSILARAFRGELGTNDPSEAGAQELLQEILAS